MHRLRLRDRQQALRPGLAIPVLVAALIALTLVLPAAASAVEKVPLTIEVEGGEGQGEIKCEVNGSGHPVVCEAEYSEGKELTLVPFPKAGSEFVGFENGEGSAEDCAGTESCTFIIEEESSVEAPFDLIMLPLTIEVTGEGEGEVECEVEGVAESCEGEEEYPYGTELTLVPTVELYPDSEFVGFENGEGSAEDCAGTESCTFIIEEESYVEVQFDVLHRVLEVKKAGVGSGTVTSSPGEIDCGSKCSAKYEEEVTVTLTAAPASGSTFAGWSGCDSEDEGKCVVTLEEADATVTAAFTAKFTLTVEETGPGSVTSSPGSISCGSDCSGTFLVGTKVTLTAVPAKGSFFTGWAGGGCKGILKTCTVPLNADTTVAAEFEAIPPPDPEEELIEVEAGTAVAAATAQVKAGKAALKLTCSGGPCKGTLKLRAKVKQGKKVKTLVIGTASFKLSEDATKTLKVTLSAPAKRELGKGRTIKAKLSGTGIAASTVKLKPA